MAWIVSYPPAKELERSSVRAPLPIDKLIFPIGTFNADDLDTDNFMNQWFSQNFLSVDEGHLTKYSPDQAIFRLTVIPTFTSTYTFRLTKAKEGNILIFKAADGAGGYDLGKFAEYEDVSLKNTNAEILISTFEKLDICNLPEDDRIGADGSQWLLESYEKGKNNGYRYCFASYWSPDSGKDETRKSMVELRTLLAGTVVNFKTEEEVLQKILDEAQNEN